MLFERSMKSCSLANFTSSTFINKKSHCHCGITVQKLPSWAKFIKIIKQSCVPNDADPGIVSEFYRSANSGFRCLHTKARACTNNRSGSMKYIEPETLFSLIGSPRVSDDFVIIDVRDEDEFESGHIGGAQHIPSELWYESPQTAMNVLNEHMNVKSIVVHCFMSQQRGPACARMLANKINSLNLLQAPEM